MQFNPGDKIHIYTKGATTMMTVDGADGSKSITVLADTERQLGCNLHIEVGRRETVVADMLSGPRLLFERMKKGVT